MSYSPPLDPYKYLIASQCFILRFGEMIALFVLCFSVVSAGPSVLRNVLDSPSGLAAMFKQHVSAQGKYYAPSEMNFRLRVFRYDLLQFGTLFILLLHF